MIRFGDYTLDTRTHVLSRGDQFIPLPPKDYQMLRYLLEHRDRIIAKQELSAQLWPGQLARNTALESTMKRVRQAIGDSGRTQRYIQTWRGSGYRFVAAVEETEASPASHAPSPASAQDHAVPPPPFSQAEKATRPLKNAKILVVDDEPMMVQLFCDILSRDGFKVLTTTNGIEAVDIAFQEQPDMVIIDVDLDDVSGLDVLEAIKRDTDTLIIVCSGKFTSIADAVESIKRGADDFFTKPFEMEDLLRMVKKYLLLERPMKGLSDRHTLDADHV